MNYTKGEWLIDHKPNMDYLIYHLTPSGKQEWRWEKVALVQETYPNAEANAHLIAASPRLHQFAQHLADEGNREAQQFLQTLDL